MQQTILEVRESKTPKMLSNCTEVTYNEVIMQQLACREPAEHIDPCPACEQRKGSVDAKKRMDEDDMHVTSRFSLSFL